METNSPTWLQIQGISPDRYTDDLDESQETQESQEVEPSQEQLDQVNSYFSQHWAVEVEKELELSGQGNEPRRWAFKDDRLLYEVSSRLSNDEDLIEDPSLHTVCTVAAYQEIYWDMQNNIGSVDITKFDEYLDKGTKVIDEIKARGDGFIKDYMEYSLKKSTKLSKGEFDARHGRLYDSDWFNSLPNSNELKQTLEAQDEIEQRTSITTVNQEVFESSINVNGLDIWEIFDACDVYERSRNLATQEEQSERLRDTRQLIADKIRLFNEGWNPNESPIFSLIDSKIKENLMTLGILNTNSNTIFPEFIDNKVPPTYVEVEGVTDKQRVVTPISPDEIDQNNPRRNAINSYINDYKGRQAAESQSQDQTEVGFELDENLSELNNGFIEIQNFLESNINNMTDEERIYYFDNLFPAQEKLLKLAENQHNGYSGEDYVEIKSMLEVMKRRKEAYIQEISKNREEQRKQELQADLDARTSDNDQTEYLYNNDGESDTARDSRMSILPNQQSQTNANPNNSGSRTNQHHIDKLMAA